MKFAPAKNCNLKTAYNAARAFCAFAEPYLAEVPTESREAELFVGSSLGAFVAATTNLALSVELLLKCEAMACDLDVLHTHDLTKLFFHLPITAQKAVESRYDSSVNLAGTILTAIDVTIGRTQKPPTPERHAFMRSSLMKVSDLKSLLAAENDSFETWRYFFAEGPGSVGDFSVFRNHFRRLKILSIVLQTHLADADKRKTV